MDMATGEKEKQLDKGESWRSPQESFDISGYFDGVIPDEGS